MHTITRCLASGLMVLACQSTFERPSDGATAFVVEDPALAAAVQGAAEDWARAGLEIANYVTINDGEPGAVPVRALPREQLPFACFPSRSRAESARQDPAASDGCVAAKDGRGNESSLDTDRYNGIRCFES